MPEDSPIPKLVAALETLLDETFTHAVGYYLYSNTSLFEVLDGISAEEASRPLSARAGATIAAHVDHARLYLSVQETVLRGEETGDIDWEAIWQGVRTVTPDEWRELRRSLQDAHARVRSLIRSFDETTESDRLENALAVLAHSAYHLGAIQQILMVARS